MRRFGEISRYTIALKICGTLPPHAYLYIRDIRYLLQINIIYSSIVINQICTVNYLSMFYIVVGAICFCTCYLLPFYLYIFVLLFLQLQYMIY
jgi:hypothetical protein